jgi:hypothetical protein
MIKVTLTSVTGTTKGMSFDSKENLMLFIDQLSDSLPLGTALCVDAPLVGIHNGWVQGKAKPSKV